MRYPDEAVKEVLPDSEEWEWGYYADEPEIEKISTEMRYDYD